MEFETRDHGTQPLDRLMTLWHLDNHNLVEASDEQLSHKQVQKARKGRQLTLHLMQKITRALNQAALLSLEKSQREAFVPYLHRHLFAYAKGHQPDFADPNAPLFPA